MTFCRRLLHRLNQIDRKYGDVALAGTLLFLTVSAYGALAQVSLHRQGAPSEGISVAELQQIGASRLADAAYSTQLPASGRSEIELAQASEQLSSPMKTTNTGHVGAAHSSQYESGTAQVSTAHIAGRGPEIAPALQEASAGGPSPSPVFVSLQDERADIVQHVDPAPAAEVSALMMRGFRSETFSVSALSGSDASAPLQSDPRDRQEAIAALAQ